MTSRSSSTRRERRGRPRAGATSPSTRWRAGSRTASSSIPSGAAPTSSGVSSARSRHGASPRIRCASCAASGSSRSSGSIPTRRRCAQMARTPAVGLVSGERIGGGLAADGMGSSRSSCSAREPRKALRLARDTGVLAALLPEFEPAIGFDAGEQRPRHDLDEHTFAVVQAAADAGDAAAGAPGRALPRPRQAASPGAPTVRRTHAKPARRARHRASSPTALDRLRYPNDLRQRVVRSCASTRSTRRGRRRSGPGACSPATGTGSRSTCSTTGRRSARRRARPTSAPDELERLRGARSAELRARTGWRISRSTGRPDRARLRARARARPGAAEAAARRSSTPEA